MNGATKSKMPLYHIRKLAFFPQVLTFPSHTHLVFEIKKHPKVCYTTSIHCLFSTSISQKIKILLLNDVCGLISFCLGNVFFLTPRSGKLSWEKNNWAIHVFMSEEVFKTSDLFTLTSEIFSDHSLSRWMKMWNEMKSVAVQILFNIWTV